MKFYEKTGGLAAIHKEHKFDKTIGIFGIAGGDYERLAQDVLYRYGRKIILESEIAGHEIKIADGSMDDKICDIKGIESMGKYTLLHHKDTILFSISKHFKRFFILCLMIFNFIAKYKQ